MIDLNGKVTLITGATRSIGEYIARGLHACGAHVVITGIEDERGEAIASDLGQRAVYRRMNITSDAEIDQCLAEIRRVHGHLDAVVNSACSYLDNGISTKREDWLAALNVNVVGAAILVDKAVPLMTRPNCSVINIGSVAGKFGNGFRGPYSVGKAGLMHFTRLAAVALGDKGIRVVTVSPGWTWSPPMEAMTDNNRDLADRAGAEVTPLGRVGRMNEVANVVAFAISDDASWVNGCDLAVDGGFSMLGPDQGLGPRYWTAHHAQRERDIDEA